MVRAGTCAMRAEYALMIHAPAGKHLLCEIDAPLPQRCQRAQPMIVPIALGAHKHHYFYIVT